MMNVLWLLMAWLCLTFPARAALEIWYVRHAEGGHNVTWEYQAKGIPTNEWPVWVGDANALTPKGLEQVQALSTNLPETFDLIAVSPLWRTRQTIAPYLERTGQQAEIWPELMETRNFDRSDEDPEAPLRPEFLAGKSDLVIDNDESTLFRVREHPPGRRLYDAWPSSRAEALYLSRQVTSMLHDRFGTNDARVLLVGHGNASMTLVRQLTGDPSFHGAHLGNTHLWVVTGGPGGYILRRYNEPARPD